MDADAPEAAGTVAEGGSAARATRWSVLERIIGLTKDRDNKVVSGSSSIAQCKASSLQQLAKAICQFHALVSGAPRLISPSQ